MRFTLADLKNPAKSRCSAAWKLCTTDPRFTAVANESMQRLVWMGAVWGLVARYRCTTTDGLLVWPKGIAGILAFALNRCAYPHHGIQWDFQALGMGIQDVPCGTAPCGGSWCPGTGAIDMGTLPVQTPITGTTNKVKVYCDMVSDAGTPILIMGLDQNGNWIRTLQGGVWQDGEVVLASVLGTLSVNYFTAITGVQKQVTNGPIRMYAYDTALLSQTSLAIYDYDDVNPSFRVSRVPIGCVNQPSPCSFQVDVLVKLDFVPVRMDTDFLVIGNLPAIKDMGMAIIAAEAEPTSERKTLAINNGLSVARQSLEMELRHYQGAPQDVVTCEGTAGPTLEPVEGLV